MDMQITALQENLADSERVTRDVLLVLRGVKVDMASAAVREPHNTSLQSSDAVAEINILT